MRGEGRLTKEMIVQVTTMRILGRTAAIKTAAGETQLAHVLAVGRVA